MMQKTVKMMLALTLTFVYFISNSLSVLADTDITPPTIKGFYFNKTLVQPGEKITMMVYAEDIESGLSDNPSDNTIRLKSSASNELTESIQLEKKENEYSANLIAEFIIPANTANGTWSIYSIDIKDKAGNNIHVNPIEGDSLFKSFKVIDYNTDKTPPKIKSVSFNKKVVKPGQSVLIEVEAEDLETGIDNKYDPYSIDKCIQLKGPGTNNTSNVLSFRYNEVTNRYEVYYTVPTNIIYGSWSTYVIRFKDRAGNVAYINPKPGDSLYQTIRVSDDIIPPTVPTVGDVTDQSTSITGTAEANSTVNAKVGNTNIGTTTVKSDGTYSISIPPQKAGVKIVMMSTDSSGNESETIEVFVKDVTAPNAPIVNEVTDKTLNVTGTAEENATIAVMSNSALIDKTIAKNDGTFSVPIELQKARTKLTITATDAAGYTSSESVVIVKDTVKPIINGVVDSVINVGDEINVLQGITASDNLDGDITSKLLVNGTVDSMKPNNYTVTYSVTDLDGNVTTINRKITVIDAIKPIISGVEDTSIGINQPFNSLEGITARDNVDGDITKSIQVTGILDLNKKGVYKLTYTVIDSSGNTASILRTITVIDNVKPTITGINDTTLYMRFGDNFNPLEGVQAVDNVDGEITNAIKVTGVVNFKKKGVYTLNYSVSDSSGNSTVLSRTITLVDDVAPEMFWSGSTRLYLNEPFGAVYGAKDNNDGDLTKAIIVTGAVDTKKKGVYTLIYTVSDSSGNTASMPITITVIDNVKPVLIGASNKTISINSVFNPLTGVTAKDNSDGDLTKSIKVTGTVNTKKKGVYTLTYTISDLSGNTTTVNRTITVVDNIKPIISGAITKTISFGSTFNTLTGVTAKDNVDGDLTKSIKVIGTVNTKKLGVYTLTYTVSDKSGNKTVLIRKITVKDMTKPVIYGATSKTIKLKSTFNARTGVVAKDNIDGVITKYIKITNSVNTKKKGTYTIVYSVKDRAGNVTTVNRKITVK
ncbi:immunoglobulin-like domain-containing protein [Bacillus sp. AFS096315]|uniref:immunoglobulin-like domain-containing protein n=1 Tax=Bacillus sp. AFS096315 TaxID=2033517 RepID=UPI000BEB93A8|nr:immunoglobulin-like domain-containing protein [Bacillus sp. AFS096315]PEC46381.1 hypothetical protein CON00_23965 [Bacillus sp. AFS096315]